MCFGINHPLYVAMSMFEVTIERDADNRIAAFCIGARRIEVLDTVDCWPGADHLYVKLRCADEEFYILRQNTAAGGWELTFFESPASGADRPPTHPPARK